MKRITVFCSSKEVDSAYAEAAIELGKLIGANGWALVWGGQDTGLMRTISDTVKEYGGSLISIVHPEHLRSGPVKQNVDKEVVAGSVAEHKESLRSDTDAIVVLAGGLGTLDELTEIIELKKHNQYDKPLIVINTKGFYDGLQKQLIRMKEERFIVPELKELVVFVPDVVGVEKALKK